MPTGPIPEPLDVSPLGWSELPGRLKSASAQPLDVQVGSAGAETGNPPIVTLVSPANGAQITGSTPVVVLVTDPDVVSSFRALVLAALLSDSTYEVIHDGTSFSARYAGSIRGNIPGGYSYTIQRVGNWPSGALTFRAFVVDNFGNVPT